MKRVLVFVCLFCTTQFSYANGSSGWRGIKHIKAEGTMATLIYPDTAFLNPDNCGRSDFALINFTDPAKQDKVSIALAAFMGGKKINSWFAGCQDTPWGYSVPVMYNITIG
ncbi:hypothetical protein [Aliiglaciecola sp. M165]|uniref:hypothetical protein n=1 Tax=Aliiglaciecola sp. M165 TaxID=2593649 RepID=UPI00117ECA26|nr:hypothetical protein [Aliiglaciecola sp. M165]TRY33417.1 hypothetical protein FM019_05430 [Aliiglaciecola sp. M165]